MLHSQWVQYKLLDIMLVLDFIASDFNVELLWLVD